MARNSFKITFTLGDSDTAYFRSIYRAAKKNASEDDRPKIVRAVRKMIKRVRDTKRAPEFVMTAITTLEDLIQMLEDEAYALPASVANSVLAALAYFANPKDVIPDDIPLVGFLDDAIMIMFVEEDLKHELWGYRKFRRFRDGAEQRPWSAVARSRLPERLAKERLAVRAKIRALHARDAAKAAKAS